MIGTWMLPDEGLQNNLITLLLTTSGVPYSFV